MRGVALHESPSCSGEDSLDECGRPCDTLSFLLFSALWLRWNQSLLVQETNLQRISTSHVLRRFYSVDLRFLLMFPAANNNEVPFQLPHAPAGDRVLFRHDRRYYNVLQGGMDVAPSFLKACDVLLGTPGAWWDLFSPDKGTANLNSNISKDSWKATIFVYRRYMERMSFFKLSRCWLRDFDSLVPFFLIMRMREDRLCAFTETFCQKKLLFHMSLLVTAVIILSIFDLGDTTSVTWQIVSYSPALACISLWCGRESCFACFPSWIACWFPSHSV